jgi:hypothetical protein
LTINRKEPSPYRKINTPQRDIYYSSIRTKDFELNFNLKGEIKMIRGLGMHWPHPYNWLTRSDGNDWVYYKTGSMGKRKIVEFVGENYLPCLTYQSNQIFEFNPYTDPAIASALAEWSQVYGNLYEGNFEDLDPEFIEFVELVLQNGEDALHNSAKDLHDITGGRISVLPPDTRHVNYEVIPLMISEGCIYNCKFCYVKSKKKFQTYSQDQIVNNIAQLKAFYGENVKNYNGLFLGNHDGLFAGFDTIDMAASKSYEQFDFNDLKEKPRLFLFGSADSFLRAENSLSKINDLPYHTYINIGFESMDKDILNELGKPLTPEKNQEVFNKMIEVNRDYKNIEVTANFILSENFREIHNQSIIELLQGVDGKSNKGGIYFSPLVNNQNREATLDTFFEIKKQVSYPVFIYLIQRL